MKNVNKKLQIFYEEHTGTPYGEYSSQTDPHDQSAN
jgi:hypothetical protein